MRFMMMVMPKDYAKAAPDMMPPPELVEKMARYNDSLAKAGVLLSLEGLAPPSKGARVHFGGGKPRVQDGPFAESKELVGGFWMIQVRTQEDAVEWAKRAPMLDGDAIEVRQVYEMGDYPPEVQKAAARKA